MFDMLPRQHFHLDPRSRCRTGYVQCKSQTQDADNSTVSELWVTVYAYVINAQHIPSPTDQLNK